MLEFVQDISSHGSSNYSNDFRLASSWKTHVTTSSGLINQVPRACFFPPYLSQMFRCNAGIWAVHYLRGSCDYSYYLKLTSRWETQVTTTSGSITQVFRARFFLPYLNTEM